MAASAPPPPSGPGPAPSVAIPRSAARRLDVRALDPAKAVRLDGDDALAPTLYAGNRLLVRGLASQSAQGPIGALSAIAERLGYSIETRARRSGSRRWSSRTELGDQVDAAVSTTGGVPAAAGPARGRRPGCLADPADPARGGPRGGEVGGPEPHRDGLGLRLRSRVRLRGRVRLGCRVRLGGRATARASGTAPGSVTDGVGDDDARRRAVAALPVVWGPSPVAQGDATGEVTGPVVALLDTGLGQHPWFTDGVIRDVDRRRASRSACGSTPADDPELTGCTLDRVNGVLDPLAGHGTFIAGVVRQHCPEATLMIVPGHARRRRHRRGLPGRDAHPSLRAAAAGALRDAARARPIDVLSLSLGYYHETPGAFDDEPAFCQRAAGAGQHRRRRGRRGRQRWHQPRVLPRSLRGRGRLRPAR